MVASLKSPMPLVAGTDPSTKMNYLGNTGGAPQPISTGADSSSPMAAFTAAPQATNTDVTTSADMNSTDVRANAIPASGSNYGYGSVYGAQPIGGLQSNASQKPENYLTPQAREYMGYGNAAYGGVAAGGQVTPTRDATDSALGVIGSGLGGAAAGAAAGGPIGAAIGGIAGLVTGGINAYVGTHAARQKARQEEKIRAQIAAKDEARYQQARADEQKRFDVQRGDTLENERYNRRMAAIQSQWQAQEAARRALNDAITNDQGLRQMLSQEVR